MRSTSADGPREDPLFDPWSVDPGPEPPSPSPEPDEAPAPRPSARWQSPNVGIAPRPSNAGTTPRSPARASRSHSPEPPKECEDASDVGIGDVIRATLTSRLEWLRDQLQIAGHESMIDDRLGAEVPSIRLRVVPRTAPLKPRRQGGAVLELSGDERRSEVIVRIWLDQMTIDPTEERRVVADALSDELAVQLLLDFLARTLQNA